ncbi:DoxX family protein [Pseudoalteromonas denitrificans]|jgi:putative oxidoreductase|uniref:Putative oxidoreductase n=1 Tax=Pseudoalteromonas denitrificans DSM 6059 TaxID=1123010 RepID=A0A1I1G563_9GAMM|nr:DoxX family protein [Pseudoalteromonas denitrificans]SFC06969.1 putative oxidoreductase [Pseudoalteromonas denitrificans DSM 6059]
MDLTSRIILPYQKVSTLVNLYLQPVALLMARVYVGWVFFAAGLTKIKEWDTTLFLFEEEYQVPFINFELAAYLGTAGELILPIILVLGIASRIGALGLSMVNIVAVISLEEIAPAALTSHFIWGVLLIQLVVFGAGKVSIDSFIKSKIKA